jgi:uncharacterized protein YaeQ
VHKYTLDITCNGVQRKLIVARGSGESEEHIALKLLAYLLYFEREPRIEQGVEQTYKPDLVCHDGRDVTLWVDCGDIRPHKLDRVLTTNRQAEVVVVKPNLRTARTYKELAEKRLRRPERTRYLTFENGFVERFVALLEARSTIAAQATADPWRLELTLNGKELASSVVEV